MPMARPPSMVPSLALITSANDEAPVQLVYPAAAIELNNDKNPVPAAAYTEKMLAQDGTLSYIASNLDLRVGESTLAVDGDKATLSANVSLASQIAIWKLTLLDSNEAELKATQVKIKSGGNDLASTAVLTTGKSTLYLAVPGDSYDELTIEATVGEDTYSFTKSAVTLNASAYYQSTVTMEKIVDLSTVTTATTIKDGYTVTGTLDVANYPVKISIAAGATVTLDGVTINGENNESYGWAGITCLGDATIILKDGTTNTVKGFHENYPGIYVPENKTLTIQGGTAGTGSLDASSNGRGAGIGGGGGGSCGYITISGGKVTAQGGSSAAGIGGGGGGSCGYITISGGTVTATGGKNGAGIGSGYMGSCGNIKIEGGTVTATGGDYAAGIGGGKNNKTCGTITITSGVTSVTATKGADAPNSIGAGAGEGTCGTVTIGCTLNSDGSPIGGTTGAITTSPYTYDPSAPAAWAANEYNEGLWDGTKVVFTKQTAASVTAVANSAAAVTWSAGWYTVSGNVTITGNVTLDADTHLILQDGATLTINGQLNCRTNNKNLYIYGQKKGDGKLNVTYNSGNAIYSKTGYRIDIHGGEVTAAATGDLNDGLFTGYLAVYGGKLTATSGGGNGIGFYNTIDVYGGEVVATSNATSASTPLYGISNGGNANRILTVYGGKVTATGNGKENYGFYGSGFSCHVKSGASGIKFYFSDSSTTWGDGTSYDSATSVGSNTDAAATQKRYAKAE